jgi:hypothetical protein
MRSSIGTDMISKYAAILQLLSVLTVTAFSGEQVFTNAMFPYRVVCTSEWVEVEKSDTVLILENNTPGKKTRMEMYRYTLDTTGVVKNINWAAFNFYITKELTYSFGKLVFFDTSAVKKLGGYRAYELYAMLSDSTKKTWWAELNRWAKSEKYGYLVTIFGDTTDMKENHSTYSAMLDSIQFDYSSSLHLPYFKKHLNTMTLQKSSVTNNRWHTLLGREVTANNNYRNNLLVAKRMKRCPVR